jgi:hypothetical protein
LDLFLRILVKLAISNFQKSFSAVPELPSGAIITPFKIFHCERSKNTENSCNCKTAIILGNCESIIYHWIVPLFDHMTKGKISAQL